MQNIIFEGGAAAANSASSVAAAGYDPDETQSQDSQGLFTLATYDQDSMHDAFMEDQVGLDGFPLDHEFP